MAWPIGSVFHVEPSMLLTNACASLAVLAWSLFLLRWTLPRGLWVTLVLAGALWIEWWTWIPAENPEVAARMVLPFLLGGLGLVLSSEAFPAACRSRY
ncbi:MAG: hypothetical protein R3F30_00970 [Planctomycetota bacterium]